MFISDRTNRNPRRGHRLKAFNEIKGKYIRIPNELLMDKDLSWKAKGLFCFMAHKKDTYNFTVNSLATQFPDGKTAIRAAMDELKDKGWMIYIKKADGYGKYKLKTSLKPKSDNRTKESQQIPTPEPQADKQTMAEIPIPEPQSEIPTMAQEPKSENPKEGFTTMGKPDCINNTDLANNTDLYKGDKKNSTEKDQKQKQDHLQGLSSTMKLKVSQIANHFSSEGVQNAN